jgi:23S rRNA (uracil1939-C5)-methyltransferase
MSETVIGLAARGDGITDTGGHVALAAPGDVLRDDGTIAPGPHHAVPPCRHFPACGGCRLQHVDDESYARFLVDRIATALGQHGIAPPEIQPPHLSPPHARRRAALRALRHGRQLSIGFNEAASHRVVDMRECHILAPALFALVDPLRRLLVKLLPNGREARVEMTLADQGIDLLLEGVSGEGLAASEALTDFARDQGLARLSLSDDLGTQAWWEPEPVTVTLSGVAVPLPAGAFLQATADGETALVDEALVMTAGARRIADLFAGLGTFALAFWRSAEVHAVEGAADAVGVLTFAARRSGRPVQVEHRDLFRRPLTAAELDRFDAVLFDPPRAGARDQAIALAASRVERIVAVSCNPATFARDARALADGGYRLERIKPIGQFRWSTHVELIAAFRR